MGQHMESNTWSLITREEMDHANITLKSATYYCKFTNKPMYFCEEAHVLLRGTNIQFHADFRCTHC